ncbi:MAG TPA: ISNCY family transposase [Longimicrobium sp.]|nr:ISNCY family transposase [Longimicrobium sp.]
MLHQIRDGHLSVAEGARRLGLGRRHVRRLLRGLEQRGDTIVVHGLRERPSNRRLPPELRVAALEKARDPLYADFGPTLLSEHLARDPAGGVVHPATLRLWMIEEGLWFPTPRRLCHRRRRERRPALGELVLMDTSEHEWLEGRGSERMVLIAMIDDATSRLRARFFPTDSGAANRRMIVDYLECHGRMAALYTDRAGHFQVSFQRTRRMENDQAEALTLIRRALDALEIELILALSPQAKGRVERLFKTLQDRLIKEMRVAGIRTLDEANRFLEAVFLPLWHERFTVAPQEATDAHRPLPAGTDLLRLFAETEQRVIRNDFTFRFRNRHYQIEAGAAVASMPKSRITIEKRLDGTTRFRWRDSYVPGTPLLARPEPPLPEPASATPRPLAGAAGKPLTPDHPWRRSIRVGRGRFLPRTPPVVASASLRPDTPALGAAD